MIKKTKTFIISHLKVLLWIILYIGIQGLIMAGLSFLYMVHCARHGLPIPNLMTTTGLEALTSPVILPTIVFSMIPIVSLAIGKWIVTKKPNIKKVSLNNIFKYIFMGYAINIILVIGISLLPDNVVNGYNNYINGTFSDSFLVNFLSMGIASPVTEEVIFREMILGSLSNIHPIYGAIISSLLFGLMHGTVVQVCYAFIMGLVFAYVDIKEKNILPSIIMHTTVNVTSVCLAAIGAGDKEIPVLVGALLLTGGIWIFISKP